MKKGHILLMVFSLLMIPFLLSGQGIPEDKTYAERFDYRSSDNPWYWKNKLPFPGYWQQDVHYVINAVVNDSTDIVSANMQLTYYNNSPDTLYEVYFHLYQEAFQPGSYAHSLYTANKQDVQFGEYEKEGLGTEVESMHISAINGFATGKQVTTEQENTILKVHLPEPLRPNGSMTFEVAFQTYFDKGGVRRRMKLFEDWGLKHYDGVHWYPRICVYDRKFGWTTDQHLGKEFYGDFGSFDVRLTFPDHYIVGATGTLVNPEDAMPSSLREKLDISHFATKPWNSAPSEIITPTPGSAKTWHFKAANVHDFSFTADPAYRIGEAIAMVDGRQVLCQALVQEQHAAGWQNAADYTVKIIETFSRDFGSYVWPKIIVADARDGMEYPMLTLDGGFDPYYRDLLIHEVGHMWFFGMLGTNETYRAFMDEGFTQFITNWGYQTIDGPVKVEYAPDSRYKAKYRKPTDTRLSENYYGYYRDAVRQNDPPLNTHSDHFGSALGHGGGYSHVYHKTAVMLHNLQYVLGDELFLKAMQHYVGQWKIAHPYPEDFRHSIIQYTGVDLNWFFDQWLETNKYIDYAVKDVKKAPLPSDGNDIAGSIPYQLTFERKGTMQMPLDFIVTTINDDTLHYHIPNTWFVKENGHNDAYSQGVEGNTSDEVVVFDRWIGWDELNKTYTATVYLPAKPDNVIIDPTRRLADVNYLDNTKNCPVDFGLDHRVWNWPDAYNYDLNWRPDIWYNEIDGIKAGVHFNGNYASFKHIFSFTAWANTTLAQGGFYNTGEETEYNPDPFSVNASYRTATDRMIKGSDFYASFRYLDGIIGGKAGLAFKVGKNEQNRIDFHIKAFKAITPEYLPFTFSGLWNNSLNTAYIHNYKYPAGKGKITTSLRTTAPFSEVDFNRISLEAINDNRLGKFDLRTRFFVQAGTSTGITPTESQLYLAGANPEEYLDNKFTRSLGWVPNDWYTIGAETNHFQMGGGLNLRGYAGYLAPQEGSDGNFYTTVAANSGAAVNMELAFDRFFKSIFRPVKMTPYLFADAGTLLYTETSGEDQFSLLRMDAGIGATFSWKWWGPLEKVDPFTVRVDLPLFLNRPPFIEEDYVRMRWVIGLERAF